MQKTAFQHTKDCFSAYKRLLFSIQKTAFQHTKDGIPQCGMPSFTNRAGLQCVAHPRNTGTRYSFNVTFFPV